jgi:hypothetical protein
MLVSLYWYSMMHGKILSPSEQADSRWDGQEIAVLWSWNIHNSPLLLTQSHIKPIHKIQKPQSFPSSSIPYPH